MRKIILIWLMLTVCLVLQAQSIFRGVDFTNHHFSALDSALLSRNSVMYSGRNIYGMETDNKETVYSKWYNNKEKFYPVMCEAWKYCLNKLPYQLNMYKDGAFLYKQMMHDHLDDSVYCKKYLDCLMKLYDLRIQNLDSINAHVKRVSDKSSIGTMMLSKVLDNDYYGVGQKEGEVFESPRRMYLLYPQYKEAIEKLQQEYEDEIADVGGDVATDALERYFILSFWRYAGMYNACYVYKTDTTAIAKQRVADSKAIFLRDYNFMKVFCDDRISQLGADYADSLRKTFDLYDHIDNEDGVLMAKEDSMMEAQLALFNQKVLDPYKKVVNTCDEYIAVLKKQAGFNIAVQTLADAMNLYDADLESHKDSLTWLYRVKRDCEMAIDFSQGSDNPYYSFYEDVKRYFEEASIKQDPSTNSGKKKRIYQMDPNYMKAQAVAKRISGRFDSTTAGLIALYLYYLNAAIVSDVRHASEYKKKKAHYTGQESFKSEMMMAGFIAGKVVTVDGVTFRVVLR